MCSERDPLSLFKGLQMGIFGFHKKRVEPKGYISSTKFEEQCSTISRDILDSVFCCSSGPIYDTITFFICIR